VPSDVASFFQLEVAPGKRAWSGLNAILYEALATPSPHPLLDLVYVSYDVQPPDETVLAALERGGSWVGSLVLVLQLIVREGDGEGAERGEAGSPAIRGIKEQRVAVCAVPFPTPEETFVVEGVELTLGSAALARGMRDRVARVAAATRAGLARGADDLDGLEPADLLRRGAA
jgi:DNA-directed RNA polymerase beta subunit